MLSKKCKYIDVFGVFLIMTSLFVYVMFGIKHESDLWAHASIAHDMLTQGRLFETNFLMYFLANLMSGFTGNLLGIRIAIVLLIVMAETGKYVLTREMFEEFTSNKVAIFCSLVLLVVYICPIMYFLKIFGIFENTHNMYMQYFVPNVWHNSTILCCMPFAIAVYWLTIKQFDNFDKRRNLEITIFLLISILIKPSFFFVYATSYPIIMLIKYRFSQQFLLGLLPIFIGILAMGYEYYTIYRQSIDGSSVAINIGCLFDLTFWKSKILYLSTSLLLPVIFICFYWRNIWNDSEFWFILLMIITSIGIYYVCQETGPRANHGNFYWQVVPSMWFVFYYILKMVTLLANAPPHDRIVAIRFLQNQTLRWVIIVILYTINTIMGLVYISKFLITHNFG